MVAVIYLDDRRRSHRHLTKAQASELTIDSGSRRDGKTDDDLSAAELSDTRSPSKPRSSTPLWPSSPARSAAAGRCAGNGAIGPPAVRHRAPRAARAASAAMAADSRWENSTGSSAASGCSGTIDVDDAVTQQVGRPNALAAASSGGVVGVAEDDRAGALRRQRRQPAVQRGQHPVGRHHRQRRARRCLGPAAPTPSGCPA